MISRFKEHPRMGQDDAKVCMDEEAKDVNDKILIDAHIKVP